MMDFEVALDQFEIFILILMRMASFVYTAPFFNTSGTPQKTKVGFSVFLSILVYSLQGSDVSVSYNGVIGYAALVLEEVAVGLLLGAVTSFCTQIILFSGKIIDMDTGISMAQIHGEILLLPCHASVDCKWTALVSGSGNCGNL